MFIQNTTRVILKCASNDMLHFLYKETKVSNVNCANLKLVCVCLKGAKL